MFLRERATRQYHQKQRQQSCALRTTARYHVRSAGWLLSDSSVARTAISFAWISFQTATVCCSVTDRRHRHQNTVSDCQEKEKAHAVPPSDTKSSGASGAAAPAPTAGRRTRPVPSDGRHQMISRRVGCAVRRRCMHSLLHIVLLPHIIRHQFGRRYFFQDCVRSV
jgi:hypothetical protein